MRGGDNKSCISVYRSDGTFDRDMMIRGKHLWYITITDDRHIVGTFHHGVMVLDQDGYRVHQFGSRGSGRGQFDWPLGVAYRRGYVYVADLYNRTAENIGAGPTYNAKTFKLTDGASTRPSSTHTRR